MSGRITLLTTMTCFAIAGAAVAGEDDAAQERHRFIGVWEGYVVEGQGENPNRGPVKLTLNITADGIVATQDKDGDLGEGTFTFDLAASPHTIDAKRTKAPGVGQTFLGIYELTDDTLKWCTGNPRKDRPSQFATKAGQFLMILKRQPK